MRSDLSTLSLEIFRSHYFRAKNAMANSDFEAAREAFLCMLDIQPSFGLAHYNLASCYIELKNFSRAYEHYQLALKFEPELRKDPDTYFNLGVCAERLELFSKAQEFYEKAISCQPDFFESYFNLGLLASKQGLVDLARERLEKSRDLASLSSQLSAKNKLPEIQFHIERLGNLNQKVISRPPAAHIKSLFDQYADHYDDHMVNKLSYMLPEIMADLMLKLAPIFPRASKKILDLGCGTGLLGQAIKQKSENFEIYGVDLSQKMLDLAKEKRSYDSLICQDIFEYLSLLDNGVGEIKFDGVMAADVFNYFGDLTELFLKISKRLNSGGWFCFSVEVLNLDHEKAWALMPTGRYAHNQNYVKDVAFSSNLKFLTKERTQARFQEGQEVNQDVYYFIQGD